MAIRLNKKNTENKQFMNLLQNAVARAIYRLVAELK